MRIKKGVFLDQWQDTALILLCLTFHEEKKVKICDCFCIL